MLRNTRTSSRGQAGIALVEVMVVLTILGIVGGIVTAGLVRGLRTDAETRSRIEVVEDLQIAMERVSREVRAANPIRPNPSADTLAVQIYDGDDCIVYSYELQDDDLTVARDECATVGTAPSQVLLRSLEPSSPGPFEYLDAGGAVLSDPVSPNDVASVVITLRRAPIGPDVIEVGTVVTLRNS